MRLAKLRGARGFVPLIALFSLGIGLAGCSGDDGKDGAQGPAGPGSTVPGPTGATGATGATGPGLDPIASAKPESCLTCHSDAGVDHQSVYRDYLDAKTKSKYKIALTSLATVANATAWRRSTVTLNFNVQKQNANGTAFEPFVDTGLGTLDQKRFVVQGYYWDDPATRSRRTSSLPPRPSAWARSRAWAAVSTPRRQRAARRSTRCWSRLAGLWLHRRSSVGCRRHDALR